jgi:hypothetical protein
MSKNKICAGLVFIAVLSYGCTPAVLKQSIPVSTNPMGAKIYVNGQIVGQTPGTVSLERNRDHILTLVKENYRQEDVIIRKQYQSEKVFMKAVQSGVNSGLFFKDAGMALSSGYGSYSMQEETGEAYILIPPAVKLDLTPLPGLLKGNSDSPSGVSRAGTASTEQTPLAPVSPPSDTGLTTKDVLKAGIIAGAAVGASQAKPIEKKWDTSSSSKTYTKPDGTIVTEKSSTSVGVGVNPAGMVKMLDVLFN